MNDEISQFIGIDVSKDSLSIFVWGQQGTSLEIKNTEQAISNWLMNVPAGSFIGLESTGRYHKLAASMGYNAGMTIFLLQPRDMSNYRRSVTPRSKTDNIDAQVLARFVAMEHKNLRLWKPSTKEQEKIDDLLRIRALCSSSRAKLAMAGKESPDTSALLDDLAKTFNQTIAQIDKAMAVTIKSITGLTENYKRLRTVSGIGKVSGAGIANILAHYEFRNADALIGYVGLDPKPVESGKYRGRRRLSKRGPSQIRWLLYLASMAAVKKEAFKPLYKASIDKGLSRTAALCIVARKILRIAYAIWNKPGAIFDPTKLLKSTPLPA